MAARGRFAFTVAGVVVATLLLSFVLGLYRGWSERLTTYVDETDTDLWVVQKGVESFFSPSVVQARYVENIRAIDGVEASSGLSAIPMLRLRSGEDAYDVYLMGFDPAETGAAGGGLGGPLRIVRGSGAPKPGEIVIDQILARITGVDIGDSLTVSYLNFQVVGISSGGNLGVTLLCFVARSEVTRLLGDYPVVSHILVRTAPGRESEVATAIRAVSPILEVFPRSEFADSTQRVLRRSILPILSVVVVLVFIVGAIVVGLTMYTTTIEKQREFGVLKALGTPGQRLVSIVLQQSVICCLVGFAIGQLGLLATVWLTQQVVPQFVTLIKPGDLVTVFVLVTVMGMAGSWLPVQRVVRVDPLVVFKA